MQMYHMLPTMLLEEKETVLERVADSITTWQRNLIALLPTRKLTLEVFETRQASLASSELEYETAFTIGAVELSYWEHQAGL